MNDGAMASRPAGPPRAIRVAGGLLGLEGVCVLGFVAFLLLRAGAATLGMQAVLGEAGMFLIVGAAKVLLAVGLWRGRPWARTPAIVIQLLLLPVVYSLIGPSKQVGAGLAAGVVVLAALLALLSEPARRWSTELDEVRRRD